MVKTWKPPTWKGLIGILTLLSGVVTALTVSPGTLPHNVEAWLIVVGGVLLAVERAMDAVDNYTHQTTQVAQSVTTPSPTLPDPTTTGGGIA